MTIPIEGQNGWHKVEHDCDDTKDEIKRSQKIGMMPSHPQSEDEDRESGNRANNQEPKCLVHCPPPYAIQSISLTSTMHNRNWEEFDQVKTAMRSFMGYQIAGGNLMKERDILVSQAGVWAKNRQILHRRSFGHSPDGPILHFPEAKILLNEWVGDLSSTTGAGDRTPLKNRGH